MSDVGSGVNRDFFNYHLRLVWRNSAGDWLDANGVAQGSNPYSLAQVPSPLIPTPSKFNVKTLVVASLTAGDTGMLLRGTSGSVQVASRHNPDPAMRPVVNVTRPDKSVQACPCISDAVLSPSTVLSDHQDPLLGPGAGMSWLMQFDYGALTAADVADAELVVTAVKYGPAQFAIYRINPPEIMPAGTVEQGLAQGKTIAQIAADPNVIFVHDWPGSFPTNIYVGYTTAGCFSYQQDAQLGNCIEAAFTPGIGNGEAPVILDYYRSQHGLDGLEEAYYQYQIMFGPDWGPIEDGGKLPGMAGRYGRRPVYQDPLQYESLSGNGGDRTTGRHEPAGAKGVPVDWLSGWSARGWFPRFENDGNPYGDLTPAVLYVYWPGMPQTGLSQYAGTGQNFFVGGTAMEKGKAYTIEHRIKMNSIDLSNPDALGNGIGRADGMIEIWLDGVKRPVLDYATLKPLTGICLRHHPDIKIDEAWIPIFLGGAAKVVKRSSLRLGRIVFATKYIGL
ncbi:MAG: hypothetical protein ABI900_02895 [Betaproteobacteria bacterium]